MTTRETLGRIRSLPVRAARAELERLSNALGCGCLMANVPEDLALEILEWSSAIDQRALASDGIETEPHVTVLYGFDPGFSPERLKDVTRPITIRLGRVSRFSNPDYDVLKLEVESPEMLELNREIAENFREIAPSEHEYDPHLTIAYVRKGARVDLDERFNGREFVATRFTFSGPEPMVSNKRCGESFIKDNEVCHIGETKAAMVPAKRDSKQSKWVTDAGEDVPEHIAKLGIPPAWQDVKISKDPKSDLQAIGRDAKGRVQRVYSSTFSARQAAIKFARNKELIEKQQEVFAENDKNLKHKDPRVAEAAACMKLIQATGIRPGSTTDTKAEKQAYGATTLEGRHVVVDKGKVSLRFVGKKGVSLNIPVEDKSTAKMLIERKEKAGDTGKLFDTSDSTLQKYSHTLDGGSFKPKDFRTLMGTQTAIEEIDKNPNPAKDMNEYKKRVMEIADAVSKKLGNTRIIALQSYINPFVFDRIKPITA